MNILEIADKADELILAHDTRNPLTILEELNITLVFQYLESVKGCFLVHNRNDYMIINDRLEECEAVWVIAHEIAHKILHYTTARNLSNGLLKYTVYDMNVRSKQEYEANVFAAELLVADDILLDYIYNYGYTLEQCARLLSMHPALIALKVEILIARGYNIRGQDFDKKYLIR